MNAPPLVETPRLVLSVPTAADGGTIFERYASKDDVTRYLGWPTHRTIADTQGFLAFSAVQWEREGAGPYLIWSRTDGRLLGGTGLGVEPGGQAITGYVLAADAWGQGFATEALAAMVDVATDVGVRRLYALCHPEHRASWRVLEKCGFKRDGGWRRQMVFPNLEPGIMQNVLCYRLGLSRTGTRADRSPRATGAATRAGLERFREACSTRQAEFAAARPTVTPRGGRASVRLRPAVCCTLPENALDRVNPS